MVGLPAPVDVLTTLRKPERYVRSFGSVIFLGLENTWVFIAAVCFFALWLTIKMSALSTLLLYILTAWSRVLLEKLTGSAASQEIPRINCKILGKMLFNIKSVF